MSLAKNLTRSVRLGPAEDKLFLDACERAGLEAADAMRTALMEWARNRGDNERLKSLEKEQGRLVDAVVALTDKFDSCVQLNVPEGHPVEKFLRDAAAENGDAELVGARR